MDHRYVQSIVIVGVCIVLFLDQGYKLKSAELALHSPPPPGSTIYECLLVGSTTDSLTVASRHEPQIPVHIRRGRVEHRSTHVFHPGDEIIIEVHFSSGRVVSHRHDAPVPVRIGEMTLSVHELRPDPVWNPDDEFDVLTMPRGGTLLRDKEYASAHNHVLFVPGRNTDVREKSVLDSVRTRGFSFSVFLYESHTASRARNRLDPVLDCAFLSGSLDASIEDLTHSLHHLGVEHVHLMGYSLGGLIASLCVAREPRVPIRSLALIAPFFTLRGTPLVMLENEVGSWCAPLLSGMMRRQHGVPVLRKGSPFKTSTKYHSIAQLHPVTGGISEWSVYRLVPAVTHGFVSASVRGILELRRRLPSPDLRVPVVVVCSNSDELLDSEEILRRCETMFPAATLTTVSFLGHRLLGVKTFSSVNVLDDTLLPFWSTHATVF